MLNFQPRLYQETIFATTAKSNTLVVLPTGMGKTAIFLMLAAHRLKSYPNSKILLLGPTKPLVDQYYSVFFKLFSIPEEKLAIFTGMVSPAKREELWKQAQIIFSTPQGLENDVLSGKISLKDVSLLGFDEAHRAVGDYAYVFLAKKYHQQAQYERIVGLTASPGDDVETIQEVCKNLFIAEVEVRTNESPDVVEYIQDVDLKTVKVDLPEEFLQIKKYLDQCYQSKLNEVKQYGYLYGAVSEYNKVTILALQSALHAKLMQGERDFELLKSISLLAEALKVQHALELIETQDISTLQEYVQKLHDEAAKGKTKATHNLVRDINFRSAQIKLQQALEKRLIHPKLEKLISIVAENKGKKMVIFNQYRDMGKKIVEMLQKNGVDARLFVGQQKKKDTGMSQKTQKKVLDEFREDKFLVLVSSSVGEEGLDIPQVDLVIFYEPIPSAIRKIQRSGRTGRLEKGAVIILMSKNTRDEAYHWVAHHKEKRMYRAIEQVKKELHNSPVQHKLDAFSSSDLKLFADYREKGSLVLKELSNRGFQISLTKLDVADYVLSERVAVEYKTVQDFVDSILDGRLLSQLKDLKKYQNPVVIIEGQEDIYAVRKIHPRAIQGMLITIIVSYGIPLLQTKNAKETADILEMIARKEQEEKQSGFTFHTAKPLTDKELQEYVVGAFPGVGGIINKELLKKFKTVKNIVNASEEELKKVDLIGEKKAKSLRNIFNREYE
ncbi:DEAD/DEAH box helicase [Candidatus Woesearchaeota archaeon]|nr:MAG: DEAD/DEAH box helicase [Candidatus Woesearchaeota archaeon]